MHLHSPQSYQLPRTPSTSEPMDHHSPEDEVMHPPSRPQTANSNARKRKKVDDPTPDTSEPRRLRRSHEACARCRQKKIKCDSQHPRCGACLTAGATCQQEDRHRNMFMPRGHLERMEHQLRLCELLLKRKIPGFDMSKLESYAHEEGIPFEPPSPPSSVQHHSPSMFMQPFSVDRPYHVRTDLDASPSPSPAPPYGYPSPSVPSPYPHNPSVASRSPISYSQASNLPNMPLPESPSSRGADPFGRDMSSAAGIVRNFNVAANIMDDPRYSTREVVLADKEDLAVGLTSGRQTRAPADRLQWICIRYKTGSLPSPSHPHDLESDYIWLPKNRQQVDHIFDVYFTRLNYHRPVFERADFLARADALYKDNNESHDPGFICSFHLILALGTLSELHKSPNDHASTPFSAGAWPSHEEFFNQALGIKPELRITISSLQALILLQWYLYIERHGRTLWRLVGSMVRLAIELGLHHDPNRSDFSPAECRLRINLWWIVMIHDRGTSVLLGRPIAIAEDDFDTPDPQPADGVSDHFVESREVTSLQADIINTLYRPRPMTGHQVAEAAKKILLKMTDFRKRLPRHYYPYFLGTIGWSADDKGGLQNELTSGIGLTFLKYGIARLLALRAVFGNGEVAFEVRAKALKDAIKMSHNVIVVHEQLIRIPDVAFFVSPLPLHLAAMTIIYGYTSRAKILSREVCSMDVNSALNLIPHFRWRWERKDAYGGNHPLMLEIADRVFPNMHSEQKRAENAELLPEEEWANFDVNTSVNIKREDLGNALLANNNNHTNTPTRMDTSGGNSPDNAVVDLRFSEWPMSLLYPGPAWPQAHEWNGQNGPPQAPPQAHPQSSQPSHAMVQHPQPQSHILSPTAQQQLSEDELQKMIATYGPRLTSNPHNTKFQLPHEEQLQQMFMEEARDPQAPTKNVGTGQWPYDSKTMERLQHIVSKGDGTLSLFLSFLG